MITQTVRMLFVLAAMGSQSFAHSNQKNKSIQSNSNQEQSLCNIAPKNDLYIPDTKDLTTGISETEFNKVIDAVENFYKPIVAEKGGSLVVNRLWKNGKVNASATLSLIGKKWIVNMYGGLARYQGVTADGFAMVMCHEVGHHLAGFPMNDPAPLTRWESSNEGQSDYFASMKCFRSVYGNDQNQAIVDAMSVPTIVSEQCAVQHKSASEIALCKRSSMAGLVLANVLASLGKLEATDFAKPDSAAVARTDNAHPKAQCRLDTYFNGAICGVSHTENFSREAAAPGACAVEKGDQFGTRPLCWYKPKL